MFSKTEDQPNVNVTLHTQVTLLSQSTSEPEKLVLEYEHIRNQLQSTKQVFVHTFPPIQDELNSEFEEC